MPAGRPENDLVGIAVTFQEDWGGCGSEEEVTKEETIRFRKDTVGKCKAIPSYLKDGTKTKVNRGTYIFKNGKWQGLSIDWPNNRLQRTAYHRR